MAEIISGPWNSGDHPDRQHCCSSNPGAPLAKTLSGCPVSVGTLSYVSVILYDFPGNSLTPLSSCVSMPVGNTQQGSSKPLLPDALQTLWRHDHSLPAMSHLRVQLACGCGWEWRSAVLPIHWFLPFVFCLNSLTFLFYIVLKIAQVRNLFRPINLSWKRSQLLKLIDWIHIVGSLPTFSGH